MRPSTKKNILIAASYAAVLIAGMFVGPKFAIEDNNRKNDTFLPFLTDRSEKLATILKLIETKYVDKVETDSLKEIALDEILTHLDPHSAYLPPVEARILNEDLEGNFYGIGIEYYLLNDTLNVTAVNVGGPAYKAGLQRGDQIIKINNKPVVNIGITGKQVVSTIRGKRGTFVDLLVKSGLDAGFKKLRIERDKIIVSTITASYLMNTETGYIKIDKFGSNTSEDFTAALKDLQKKGIRNLILDLRDNGGGYLSAATALADQFLKDKKLIVFTRGAHEKRTNYWATDEGNFENGLLAVLINENTASASEIVAGAVQDLDRGVIIGRRSFGKGLVQEQFDFGDGSALNLTIARYYTPSGRLIQKSYKQGNAKYFDEVHQRFVNGEVSSDSNKVADTSYAKKAGYKTSSGRIVYGGGGIMPDFFVPVDTGDTKYYESVYSAGLINQYVYSSLVKRLKPSSIEDILSSDYIPESEMEHFNAFVRSKGITADKSQIALSERQIKKDLKALVARYYFGDNGFYRVENSQDKAVLKALQQFQSEKYASSKNPRPELGERGK
jgi:carboxyl-terminal processing protease